MKKLIAIAVVCMFAVTGLSSASYALHNAKGNMGRTCPRMELGIRVTMRTLWNDHVSYTRNYIISSLANLEDSDAVAKRLLKNQDDIGAAIRMYYGSKASNKLSSLLKEHIMIATEVVKGAKTGNEEELKKADEKWHANADDIATFLSDANPNWSKEELTEMLYRHLELTTGEVTSRLKKDWTADIGFYDKGHKHMLAFADMLSDGIVKQFPSRFMMKDWSQQQEDQENRGCPAR